MRTTESISRKAFADVCPFFAASSTGLLLKTLGLKVTAIKIDPYMNIDAGTMAPTEHGEVFVLDDGGEVDLDLGNYERYLDITLSRENNITTGKIYKEVIEKEVCFSPFTIGERNTGAVMMLMIYIILTAER